MSELFGQQWTSRNGDVSQDDGRGSQVPTRWFLRWCKALDDLTPDDYARGVREVEKLVEHGDIEWPPSYAQFRGYAKGTRKTGHHWQHDGPAYQTARPALPRYPTAEEIERGRETLRTLREMLGCAND